MRAQFATTIADIAAHNPRVILLYGDVGGFSFRGMGEQAVNCGISEQAMIGMAAGLAKAGYIPVVYTIAPFLAERALEQIKLDIAYQELKVILVTVGASYDYATMGATHHCPADIATLYNVPGLRLLVPGAPGELDKLLRQAVLDEHAYYIRLSATRNVRDYGDTIHIGRAIVHNKGSVDAAIIAVGPAMAQVHQATLDLPQLPIIYLTSVRPLDTETIKMHCYGRPVVLVEPYNGVLYRDVMACGANGIIDIAAPREFIHHYGTPADFIKTASLHYGDIRRAIWMIYPPTRE